MCVVTSDTSSDAFKRCFIFRKKKTKLQSFTKYSSRLSNNEHLNPNAWGRYLFNAGLLLKTSKRIPLHWLLDRFQVLPRNYKQIY